MKRKIFINNSTLENSTLNSYNFSILNNTLTIHYDNKDSLDTISYYKKSTGKIKINKNINEKKKINGNTNLRNRKNMKNKNNFNNKNLLPIEYARSLKFSYNNFIQATNTQFYNYNKKALYKNCYISKIMNNKYIYSINTIKVNSTYNLKKGKSPNNIKKLKNKDSLKLKRTKELSPNKINKKINKIQSCFRGFIVRHKLYNTLFIYSTLEKLFDIFNKKFNIYKNILMTYIISNKKKSIINNELKNEIEADNNNSNDHNENSSKKIQFSSVPKNKNKKYDICNIENFNIIQISNHKCDIFEPKNNIINYTICNNNNININKITNINSVFRDNVDNQNVIKENPFNYEKTIYEEKIKKLKEENKELKEKNIQFQKAQLEYNNIKIENEKLNNINNDIIKEKEKLIYELKNSKDEYNNLLKEKNNIRNYNIINEIEINLNEEKKTYLNKTLNEEKNIKCKKNNNIIIDDSYSQKPKITDKKEREKYLKNLFKVKVYEMRDYIHKCFIKFYYNGIFLQMTGKLKHLEKNKNNDKESPECHILSFISEDSEKNINDKESNNYNKGENKKIENKEIDEKKKKKNDLKERMKKSRGLRRLMAKKANERIETLRKYFYKFYRAGIVSKFRNMRKKKTCEFRGSISLEFGRKIVDGENPEKKILKMKNSKYLSKKEIEEKEELKEKIIKSLKKIIFKADRRNIIIMKKIFDQFYLKSKLDSLTDIINNDKEKIKKKKKIRKKKKTGEKKNEKEGAKNSEFKICEGDKEKGNENY